MPTVAPYGTWRSPLSATDAAAEVVGLGEVGVTPLKSVMWSEMRPWEAGRTTIVRSDPDGSKGACLPAPWDVRSKVWTQGGGAWTPVGEDLCFVNGADQRLYLLRHGTSDPQPLVSVPPDSEQHSYGDIRCNADGQTLVGIRKRVTGESVTQEMVRIALDGSSAVDPSGVRVLGDTQGMVAWPRTSYDGRKLAWVTWDTSSSPWSSTELWVARVDRDGTIGTPRRIAGGPHESIFQPEWGADGCLFYVSDRSGWWNLYCLPPDSDGQAFPLHPSEEECGWPAWRLGFSTYAVLPKGRVAFLHGTDTWALGILEIGSGEVRQSILPSYTAYVPTLRAAGGIVAVVAATRSEPYAVLSVDTDVGDVHVLESSADSVPDRKYISVPRSLSFSARRGERVHANVYPPTNSDYSADADERPPYVVWVHGGPTMQSLPAFDMKIQFFTSRGIGVIEVNYRGSTGYGRAYRERLRGQWGVIEVDDCVDAARTLVESGLADEERLAIRGYSAGGTTSLNALASSPVFAAATSYFGPTDLQAWISQLPDSMSSYVSELVGEHPEDRDAYQERSPLTKTDKIFRPVLLLQGLDDALAPPSQAEAMAKALEEKGVHCRYVAFEDEQHGFRKAEARTAALEHELSFYGEIFGFAPHLGNQR